MIDTFTAQQKEIYDDVLTERFLSDIALLEKEVPYLIETIKTLIPELNSSPLPLFIGVKVIIKNSERKVLLLSKDISVYDTWEGGTLEIPGGRMEDGTVIENLLRELSEEVGKIKIQNIKLLGAQIISHSGSKIVIRFSFVADKVGKAKITLSPEHTDYDWVLIDEVKSLSKNGKLDSYLSSLFEKINFEF